MKKLKTIFVLLLAFELNINAQIPFMVKDINPLSTSSDPEWIVNVNGIAYFSADDGTNGRELWKSDGTAAGTLMVKDINPGGSSNPFNLTNVNGILFFQATDGVNGTELWKSDGTPTGTEMVKDIYPGNAGSDPQYLTDVNGILFFIAYDSTSNNPPYPYHLWKSDGTPLGTMLVSNVSFPNGSNYVNCPNLPIGCRETLNIVNGNLLMPDTIPSYGLTNINGILFFSAFDLSNGLELWKSDGTFSGTMMVKDINPGLNGSNPQYLTNINGTLFFIADDNGGAVGTKLYRSDGTASGTFALYNGNLHHPYSLTNVNNNCFLFGNDGTNDKLWKSDGTIPGTVKVANFTLQSSPLLFSTAVENGILYFAADDGMHGYELWKSDGTSTGTSLLLDIKPGASASLPEYLTSVNGTLFFAADDGTSGTELWAVNTTSGINELDDQNTFSIAPNPSNGTFTISFNRRFAFAKREVHLEIFNVFGQLNYSKKFTNNEQQFDCEFLIPGIYFVRINDGEKQYSRKLIRQ